MITKIKLLLHVVIPQKANGSRQQKFGVVFLIYCKEGWSIQCQETYGLISKSRRRLQGGMVENFPSPIETDNAIRTLTSQFKSPI